MGEEVSDRVFENLYLNSDLYNNESLANIIII